MAMEGRIELLSSIFGSGEGGTKPTKSSRMSASGFRSFARSHNQRYAAKGRGRRRGSGGGE